MPTTVRSSQFPRSEDFPQKALIRFDLLGRADERVALVRGQALAARDGVHAEGAPRSLRVVNAAPDLGDPQAHARDTR